MKRTLLPLNALRVFDAAARHLSFTKAAEELAVTPAAVGQQIRALEDLLGVILFKRATKGLELTDEAISGLDALRSGFLMFEESVRAIQAKQSSNHIAISATHEVTAKWLAPKLAQYQGEFGDIIFHLVTHEDAPDFTEANIDIAIHLAAEIHEYEHVKIAPCDFVKITGKNSTNNQFICWTGSPLSKDSTALSFCNAGLAIDAVKNGLGYAIVPTMLAQHDVDLGNVQILEEMKNDALNFWIAAPLPQWRQKKVQKIIEILNR
ncbi:LysR family transcriptional regulator [Sphingorhabdus lutea]|uniref:LysR family transcriptional regulator n=1 Tax=Sphingorhabdus lutea TaxID=1913578 RepID=A0A1L3JBM6_9SPHN|nr:LysR family transcriptional regulator [Sphingorhabdus lutea]APG62547.1 LysR family transcriptional regulator [Sphingorhabdus lutea]